MSTVLDKGCFAVVPIMFREGFLVFVDKEVGELFFIWSSIGGNFGEIDFQRFSARRDVSVSSRPLFNVGVMSGFCSGLVMRLSW